MATYRAIAAISQALIGLLKDACPRVEFPDAEFELYQANNFHNPLNEGITVYLFRVAPNTTRRNLPPRIGLDGERRRPPVPVDLSYLITAWGRSAGMQQRLLGWAIRTLEDTSIVPAGVLNHYSPETQTFRPDETVELVMDVISLPDLNGVWEMAKNNQQPSAVYVARMVVLESEQRITEGPPAQTRVFEFTDEVAR